MSDNIAELAGKLDEVRAQLLRATDGAAFVQDGFVRVTDPIYLLECLTEAAQALTRIAGALEPFARVADHVATNHPGWDHDKFVFRMSGIEMEGEWFRRAREALRGERP
jgi:hypothetical protein